MESRAKTNAFWRVICKNTCIVNFWNYYEENQCFPETNTFNFFIKKKNFDSYIVVGRERNRDWTVIGSYAKNQDYLFQSQKVNLHHLRAQENFVHKNHVIYVIDYGYN